MALGGVGHGSVSNPSWLCEQSVPCGDWLLLLMAISHRDQILSEPRRTPCRAMMDSPQSHDRLMVEPCRIFHRPTGLIFICKQMWLPIYKLNLNCTPFLWEKKITCISLPMSILSSRASGEKSWSCWEGGRLVGGGGKLWSGREGGVMLGKKSPREGASGGRNIVVTSPPLVSSLVSRKPWTSLPSALPWGAVQKHACCAGCRRRPLPMQLHQKAKSTHSAKSL